MSVDDNILIVGAGAIGGLVGAHLTESIGKNRVTLIDNDPAHVQTVKRRGLTIADRSSRNGHIRTVDVRIEFPDFLAKNEQNNIILATKTYSNAEVLPLLSRRAQLLVLQNGYDCRIERFPNAVKGVEFGFACQVRKPGRIYNAIRGRYVLGHPDGINDAVVNWVRLLNSANIRADTTDRIDGFLWSKLLINSALNPVSAISDSSLKHLIETRWSRELFKNLYTEGYPIVLAKCRQLRQKLGRFLGPPSLVNWIFTRPHLSDSVLKLVAARFGDVESSMLQDIRRKRPTEIDWINGAISRLGLQYRIPTPVNDWIIGQVANLEASCLQPSNSADQ